MRTDCITICRGRGRGESIAEGALRELYEETTLEAQTGPVAFVYENAPHKQSRDNISGIHTLYVVFECYPHEGSSPNFRLFQIRIKPM